MSCRVGPNIVEDGLVLHLDARNIDKGASKTDTIIIDINQDIWYEYLVPFGVQNIRITTEGSNYDTVLAIFIGPDCDNLTLVGCNDDFSAGRA